VSLMLIASAVAQFLGRPLPFRLAMTLGLVLLPVGLASLILASPALAGPAYAATLLAFGTLAIGAGHGLGFLGAMVLVNKIAPDERRAEVTSAFYVISYLGVALPAVAVGFSAQLVGLFAAVVGFSGLVGLLALALLALSRRVVAAS